MKMCHHEAPCFQTATFVNYCMSAHWNTLHYIYTVSQLDVVVVAVVVLVVVVAAVVVVVVLVVVVVVVAVVVVVVVVLLVVVVVCTSPIQITPRSKYHNRLTSVSVPRSAF